MSLSGLKKWHIVVNEVLFKRNDNPSHSFLLVEGSDDGKFWRNHIDEQAPRPINMVGKGDVVKAIRHLDGLDFRGALAVVDLDFDTPEALAILSSNLVHTPGCDLEGMLLQTRALDAILVELGDTEKITRFVARAGQDVRSALVMRALPFGLVRLANERHDLGLDLGKLGPARFLDERTWEVDHARLRAACEEAAALLRPKAGLEWEALLDEARVDDPWRVCQGHDLLKILAVGLRHVLGNQKVATCGEDRLATILRPCQSTAELEPTPLFRDVRAWEARTSPFRVLRALGSP